MIPVHWPSIAVIVLMPFLASCASLYFHDAEAPPAAVSHTPDDWPYDEYWTGIVFNGAKIGFTHLSLARSAAMPEYVIRGEAALRFRFLTMDKQVSMRSRDHVGDDLALQRFSYDYNLDGNRMRIDGAVENGQLTATIATANDNVTQTLPVTGTLYPTSAIALYPVLHGLEIGREYSFQVYDGETQKIADVTQEIEAYERSDLFEGEAYRIRTSMYGNEVTTWIDARGLPVLEISLRGVLIAALENERTARHYLTAAALNKQDVLLDFSLVRSDTPLPAPRDVTAMDVVLGGLNGFSLPPNDANQHCTPQSGNFSCRVTPFAPRAPARMAAAEREKYLSSSVAVPAGNPLIVRQARAIAGESAAAGETIVALLDWLDRNIDKKAVDAFTALDVLEQREAECQGHSYLFAAFARSLGLPTRIVNGLVYSQPHAGFLYHTWVETWTGDEWQAIDPTFGQVRADATHIKLLEGESPAELVPLVGLIGKITARVGKVERPASEL